MFFFWQNVIAPNKSLQIVPIFNKLFAIWHHLSILLLLLLLILLFQLRHFYLSILRLIVHLNQAKLLATFIDAVKQTAGLRCELMAQI